MTLLLQYHIHFVIIVSVTETMILLSKVMLNLYHSLLAHLGFTFFIVSCDSSAAYTQPMNIGIAPIVMGPILVVIKSRDNDTLLKLSVKLIL